jgi:hypothetical protein
MGGADNGGTFHSIAFGGGEITWGFPQGQGELYEMLWIEGRTRGIQEGVRKMSVVGVMHGPIIKAPKPLNVGFS